MDSLDFIGIDFVKFKNDLTRINGELGSFENVKLLRQMLRRTGVFNRMVENMAGLHSGIFPFWKDLVKLFGSSGMLNTQLVNDFLTVIQAGISVRNNVQIRVETTRCWTTLIDACLETDGNIDMGKVIRLSLNFLKFSHQSDDTLVEEKFCLWWHLIRKVASRDGSAAFEKVALPFMKFAFSSIRPPSSVVLELAACGFVELLGTLRADDGGVVPTEKPFVPDETFGAHVSVFLDAFVFFARNFEINLHMEWTIIHISSFLVARIRSSIFTAPSTSLARNIIKAVLETLRTLIGSKDVPHFVPLEFVSGLISLPISTLGCPQLVFSTKLFATPASCFCEILFDCRTFIDQCFKEERDVENLLKSLTCFFSAGLSSEQHSKDFFDFVASRLRSLHSKVAEPNSVCFIWVATVINLLIEDSERLRVLVEEKKCDAFRFGQATCVNDHIVHNGGLFNRLLPYFDRHLEKSESGSMLRMITAGLCKLICPIDQQMPSSVAQEIELFKQIFPDMFTFCFPFHEYEPQPEADVESVPSPRKRKPTSRKLSERRRANSSPCSSPEGNRYSKEPVDKLKCKSVPPKKVTESMNKEGERNPQPPSNNRKRCRRKLSELYPDFLFQPIGRDKSELPDADENEPLGKVAKTTGEELLLQEASENSGDEPNVEGNKLPLLDATKTAVVQITPLKEFSSDHSASVDERTPISNEQLKTSNDAKASSTSSYETCLDEPCGIRTSRNKKENVEAVITVPPFPPLLEPFTSLKVKPLEDNSTRSSEVVDITNSPQRKISPSPFLRKSVSDLSSYSSNSSNSPSPGILRKTDLFRMRTPPWSEQKRVTFGSVDTMEIPSCVKRGFRSVTERKKKRKNVRHKPRRLQFKLTQTSRAATILSRAKLKSAKENALSVHKEIAEEEAVIEDSSFEDNDKENQDIGDDVASVPEERSEEVAEGIGVTVLVKNVDEHIESRQLEITPDVGSLDTYGEKATSEDYSSFFDDYKNLLIDNAEDDAANASKTDELLETSNEIAASENDGELRGKSSCSLFSELQREDDLQDSALRDENNGPLEEDTQASEEALVFREDDDDVLVVADSIEEVAEDDALVSEEQGGSTDGKGRFEKIADKSIRSNELILTSNAQPTATDVAEDNTETHFYMDDSSHCTENLSAPQTQIASCNLPVELLIDYLTDRPWSASLLAVLQEKNISTVGQLVSLTEFELRNVPVRAPKVETIRNAVSEFLQLPTNSNLTQERVVVFSGADWEKIFDKMLTTQNSEQFLLIREAFEKASNKKLRSLLLKH